MFRVARAVKDEHALGAPAASRPRAVTPLARLAGLQRTAGNSAVTALVLQRQFEDADRTGEDRLAGPPPQPDLGEGASGGSGEPVAAGRSPFGEMDGEIETGGEVHVFRNQGRTGSATWHHCGGGGGKGNQSTGSSVVVAPIYESAPPATTGGQATAWIRPGTGTVRVVRSYIGVTSGDNGIGTWSGAAGGRVYITSSAVARMAQHERGHIRETRALHDAALQPMERRIATRTGQPQGLTGPTEAVAQTLLQLHVLWDMTLANFAASDTAANGQGGTFDTTDQARADFYHNKGPKAVGGVNYDHYIEAP